MPSKPASEAAAGVLSDVVDEAATIAAHQDLDGKIFGSPAPLVSEPLIPQESVTEATDEVEQSQEEDDGLPEIQWETPDELKDLLDGPDLDDDEPENEWENEGGRPEEPVDEYENPEAARLQKQLAKMQKQLDWERQKKVEIARKSWEGEAKKYFQFADPSTIDAKSRRAFLKAAQKQHETALKILKPHYERLQAEREKLKEQALAEARAEAEQRWGAPTTGPTGVTTLTDAQNTETMRRERLQAGQSLVNVIKQKGYHKNL